MPDYAPWLRAADPNRSQSAGSEAGARLRSIREQAAASLRNHQAAMAAISQRGASIAQESRLQDRAIAAKDRAQSQESEFAATKLKEDARQADMMDRFNKQKLEAETGMARYVNTAGGLVKINPDGSEVLVPGTERGSAIAKFEGGQQADPGGALDGEKSVDPSSLDKSGKESAMNWKSPFLGAFGLPGVSRALGEITSRLGTGSNNPTKQEDRPPNALPSGLTGVPSSVGGSRSQPSKKPDGSVEYEFKDGKLVIKK